jgi:hypothetical protein
MMLADADLGAKLCHTELIEPDLQSVITNLNRVKQAR